jgi:hypothetical protein
MVSGSPETNVDTDESRQDFIEKLQRLKQHVLDCIEKGETDDKGSVVVARTIFKSDTNHQRTITVGNWRLKRRDSTQLAVHNLDGEQVGQCYQ